MKLSEINLRDPFILPYEGVYYMYGTRCWHSPQLGFDVYTSTDLENWSEPKSIFEVTPDFWGTRDGWAPEVHYYNNKFYLFASFTSDETCRGTAILISDRPDGPFTPHSDGAVTPKNWECLDGTLYVDNDSTPYMVFCHEWVQIQNGTVCAIQLTPDLKASVGDPIELWKANDAPWVHHVKGEGDFVTDGPFFFKKDDKPAFIWSSFDKNGYVEALATTESGTLQGPWSVDYEPLLADHDGGHGMLFTTFDGQRKFICHQPNKTPLERPAIYDFEI